MLLAAGLMLLAAALLFLSVALVLLLFDGRACAKRISCFWSWLLVCHGLACFFSIFRSNFGGLAVQFSSPLSGRQKGGQCLTPYSWAEVDFLVGSWALHFYEFWAAFFEFFRAPLLACSAVVLLRHVSGSLAFLCSLWPLFREKI